MNPLARYHDGRVSAARDVTFAITRDTATPEIIIADGETHDVIDRWPIDDVFEVHGLANRLRLGARGRPDGARLSLTGAPLVEATRKLLPALKNQQANERREQRRLIGIASGALFSLVAAYVFGIPLLARALVPSIPPEWESQLGEATLAQIDQIIGYQGQVTFCDEDPDSLANRAIDRFARTVLADAGSPFTPDVKVVAAYIPNAFALPGGHSYYFSALLEQTETADEFAGVLAHELGHVHHRHGLDGLISTSATGLLVGFVLGDMTGLSVAGGLGAALIDTRFSREAEHEADAFAGAAGARYGFDPAALATLIERVAGDNEAGRFFQVFSTHPLTVERRVALEQLPKPPPGLRAFSDEEWTAIKLMCDRFS